MTDEYGMLAWLYLVVRSQGKQHHQSPQIERVSQSSHGITMSKTGSDMPIFTDYV